MLTRPRWLLHLEGASIAALALYFYGSDHYNWWLFAILFLAPDLFMLGYLKSARWGAGFYNLVHTLTGPLLLLLASLLLPAPVCVPYALIWFAHIGLDRMLGFGPEVPYLFQGHAPATRLRLDWKRPLLAGGDTGARQAVQ